MTLATAIYNHLTSDGVIQSIAGVRVYPVGAPQEDVDSGDLQCAVVYALLSRQHDYALPGNKTFDRYRWEFQCLAAEYDKAHELCEAVIASLNHFRGVMGGDGGVTVQHCILQDQRDETNEDLLARGIYGATAEFEIAT